MRKFKTKVAVKVANGTIELQEKLEKLVGDNWQVQHILQNALFRFTVVATKKVRERGV